MIQEQDYRNVTAWLAQCRRPLLLTHRRPDGDALGAVGGMALALRVLGLDPYAVLYEPFPPRYALIQDAASWQDWETARGELEAKCDGVVILDTCALAQLEPVAEFLARAPRTLVIDHHATRDSIGTRPGDLRIFDEDASAVSLMVAEWVRSAGIRLEPLLATALFLGIGTDCGWFRFSCTDARTLRAAAELVDAGAEPHQIYAAIYQQDSPEKLWLIARMLHSLQMYAGGRLAVMCIRQADFAASGADQRMTEDLVNEAGRLASTEATILFTEEPDQIRVNFRSKNSLDVAELARQFGGGGHARAAGARVRGEWAEVVKRVINVTLEAMGR